MGNSSNAGPDRRLKRSARWPLIGGAAAVAVLGAIAAAFLMLSSDGSAPAPASAPTSVSSTQPTQVTQISVLPACPVLPEICAFAPKVEQQIQARDYGGIVASTPSLETALRDLATRTLAEAKPRLVSIGCPFGAASSSCESSFALVFTTLQPLDDWTGTKGIVLLRYENRPAGPALAAVNAVTERDARRGILAGGMAIEPCNLAGPAADGLVGRSTGPCSRAEFFPYWTGQPFIPAEAASTPFKVEAPGQPPKDSIMYVSTGCWGCEGFDTSLQRVVTGQDGKTNLEAVAKPALQTREAVGQYFAAPNGSLIVAATCAGTGCGSLGPTSADLRARILGSRDGGFSWSELGSYQGVVYGLDVGNDGRIVVGRYSGSGAPETWKHSWELLPGPQVLSPPPGTGDNAYVRLAPDSVVWLSSSGSLIASQPQFQLPLTAADHLVQIAPLDIHRTIAVWYSGPNFVPPLHWFAGLFDEKGQLQWKHELEPNAQFSIGGLASGSLLFGNIQAPADQGYGQLPAFVDIDTGTIRPVGAPFGQQPLIGRNRFLAYYTGPFARVNGTGDCLNVREKPSTTARVVACYVDGVFLSDLGNTSNAESLSWLHVRTPGGEEGWASLSYLSRAAR